MIRQPQPKVLTIAFFLLLGTSSLLAQDRLKAMPGYERYRMMTREETNAVILGALTVQWKDGGRTFEYQKEERRYRYDITAPKSRGFGTRPC